MKDCDVLVVGAGPAGCAAAIGAARGGLATVLLDRSRPAQRWAGESLPPGVGVLMRSVFGAEVLTEEHHRRAVGTRSVWGTAELAETDFLTNPLGEGWLLDRARFDASAKAAAVAAGVTIVTVRRTAPLTRRRSDWLVELGDGEQVCARFVVDATGRSGAVTQHLGISRIATDRQVARVATYPDDGDAYSGTTVEAVADGWWYTTPLPGGRRVLAYLTDVDLWRRSARDWHALLRETRHVSRCAGGNAPLATPGAYPAATVQADRLFGDNWLAVGDAAASFDPLSSQGLATAVLMGARAGEALADSKRPEAIEAWAEAYTMLVAEHADLRAHYARLEQRWPESLFWRRREEPDDAVTRPRWLDNVRPT